MRSLLHTPIKITSQELLPHVTRQGIESAAMPDFYANAFPEWKSATAIYRNKVQRYLTRMMNVATDLFEERDRFHNTLPLWIDVFDITYLGENLNEG